MVKGYKSRTVRTCLDPEITFKYHKPVDNDVEKYNRIKAGCKELAKLILEICPENQERLEAYMTLQTVMMKASASVAIDRGVNTDGFEETKQQSYETGEED